MPVRASSGPSLQRLILVPALISLVFTIMRVLGELNHWSERWFEPVTRGLTPSAFGWVFGITWLAAPFGVYFALKLSAAEQGPESTSKAVVGGVLSLGIAAIGSLWVVPFMQHSYVFHPGLLLFLIITWSIMVIAAMVHLWTWPGLFNTLLAYGLASRIPVAVVYFLAMRGNWGTHYDYVDVPRFQAMPLTERFLETALFPQLTFWVAFTIVLGAFCGSIAEVVRQRLEPKSAVT